MEFSAIPPKSLKFPRFFATAFASHLYPNPHPEDFLFSLHSKLENAPQLLKMLLLKLTDLQNSLETQSFHPLQKRSNCVLRLTSF